jgi:tRNA(His) 5'-end guanylyltransferase
MLAINNIQNTNIINEDTQLFNDRKNVKSIKDGMQLYENRTFVSTIPSDRPFIIRLNVNGNPLNKMNEFINTQGESELFDKSYYHSMINTARSLLNDNMFKPRTVYTVADEIVLLFNSSSLFKGSTQKYLTILSSKATCYFRNHFSEYMPREKIQTYDQTTITNIKNNIPVFEGQLVFFPKSKEYEIVNYFIWRSGKRNPVDEFYRSKKGKAFILGKNNQQLKEKFTNDHGVNIESIIPTYLTYGIFMKKSLNNAYCLDDKDENLVVYTNDQIWSMEFKYGNDILDEMLAKYYNYDKWDIISSKPINKFWKTYYNSIFDINKDTQTTKSVDEEANEDQSTQNQQIASDNHYFLSKEEEIINLFSMIMIPAFSLTLIIINIFEILTELPIRHQMVSKIYVGFLYSTILYILHPKNNSFIAWIWRFWLLVVSSSNVPDIYNFVIHTNKLKIGWVVTIIYAYYITIASGFYFLGNKVFSDKKQIRSQFALVQDQRIEEEVQDVDDVTDDEEVQEDTQQVEESKSGSEHEHTD